MASRKSQHRLLPVIFMLTLVGFGMFFGALIASPDFRDGVFAKVNDSQPVRHANQFLVERKIDVALTLPTKKAYRHQGR